MIYDASVEESYSCHYNIFNVSADKSNNLRNLIIAFLD